MRDAPSDAASNAPSDDEPPRRARLPDVALPPLGGGAPVPLRAARRGTVLVLLGDAVRERDAAYLRALADARVALEGWDGRVLAVAAGDAEGLAARFGERFAERLTTGDGRPVPVLVDAGGAVAAAAGVGVPALVGTDQWGEVHAAVSAAGDAAWLPVEKVEQWLRFLAIRCAG